MNCPDCAVSLHQLLDGDTTPNTSEMQSHLAICPECRERHAAAQQLLFGLRRLPTPTVPPYLTSRIVGKVLLERRARLKQRRRWPVLAAAAALLLAPFLAVQWLRQSELADPGKPSVAIVPVKPPVKPEPKVEPLRPQFEASRHGLENVVGQWTKWDQQPLRLMHTVSLPLDMAQLDTLTQLEPLHQPLTGAGARHANEGLSLGVQTVTGTTRRALNYFMRELPPLSAPRKRSL